MRNYFLVIDTLSLHSIVEFEYPIFYRNGDVANLRQQAWGRS